MNLGHIVASLSIAIVALVLAASMLVAWKVGRISGRLRARENVKPSKFDDASVAVLSLLLGFSFGMSIAKHDQRRLAVVKDANAIEDFYTRASLLLLLNMNSRTMTTAREPPASFRRGGLAPVANA